jgi:drug/metabolite transporter (DMT)-like permease
VDKTRQSYIYAGIAILFWSTVPTAFKISLGELDILPMLTIAVFTSAVVLLIVILSGKKFVLLKAYQLLPAQIAQPLNMIWPIILVFLSVLILKQKIERKSFIALFISFAGVYIISSQGKLFTSGQSNFTGILLATGSSVFWAVYFILNVKDKRDEAVKLFLSFLFGSFYLIIAMVIVGKWPFETGFTGIAASVYVGIFEMGITFLFWLKALQMAATTDKVSNLVYLAPFISLVFVHYILHEPVYYTTPAGLLLIISGILIQNRKPAGR